MADNPGTLAYGTDAARRHSRMRVIAITAGSVIAVVVAWILYLQIKPHLQQRAYIRDQEKLAQPVLKATDIVYSDDPAVVAELSLRPGFRPIDHREPVEGTRLGRPTREVMPLAMYYDRSDPFPCSQGGAPVGRAFRAKLLAHDGSPRIIGGEILPIVYHAPGLRFLTVGAETLIPADRTPGSKAIWNFQQVDVVVLMETERLTLYAGQPDPNDPGKIQFDYRLNGKPGVLEAGLHPDGRLRLRTASGSLGIADPHQTTAKK